MKANIFSPSMLLDTSCSKKNMLLVPMLMRCDVCRAAGVFGWVKDQALAHPKTTLAVAILGGLALGALARRRR